ncbi:MAG: type I-E CRISPR-associated endonuclease Cas1e [Proteobacteria bacterium]|nr:type I-E CRISPR-associated endonuclease Cas1e [Pseudomonadota bacterium]
MSTSRHALPRIVDRWTFLYVERARIEREQNAIVLWDERGQTPVPVAALSLLMLGPGTTVTQAAMVALADNGCVTAWCGEGAVRCYATTVAPKQRMDNLATQARAWADEEERLCVVRRMYAMRFATPPPPDATLEQIRGLEGVRVRECYRRQSQLTGVPWAGRAYKQSSWNASDSVNRALSAANACLYGVVAAAVAAAGFSPSLGFIHTGKALSFVYDIADLYKSEVTVPAAFRAASESRTKSIETHARRACREQFLAARLMQRIVPDMQRALGLQPVQVDALTHPGDVDRVAALWSPEGDVQGGRNFGDLAPLRKAPTAELAADDDEQAS